MKWVWTVLTGIAALIVWDIDDLILLRLSCCVLLVGATITEAKKAFALPSGCRGGRDK